MNEKRSVREAYAALLEQLEAAQSAASDLELSLAVYLIGCARDEVQQQSEQIRLPPAEFHSPSSPDKSS
ncbi:MAG: hypothetical protein C0606_03880 [Hyphomicrobiales bacterium]|nr:MAG: hypothetical protein C0606_03880 [Hyphomicrobiales bacterium]